MLTRRTGAIQANLTFRHVRIKGIAQAIAHQVKAEYSNEDEQARNKDEPGVYIKKVISRTNHATPAGSWRLNAKAEVAENRFQNDVCTNQQSGVNDYGPGGIRQNMAEHQAEVFRSYSARRQNIFSLLQSEEFSADKACCICPAKYGNQDDHTSWATIRE